MINRIDKALDLFVWDFMAAGTGTKGRTGPAARRCNFIREALAIAALITAVPAFAQTSSPEPALEANPLHVSALSEEEAARAKAAYSQALAVAVAAERAKALGAYSKARRCRCLMGFAARNHVLPAPTIIRLGCIRRLP